MNEMDSMPARWKAGCAMTLMVVTLAGCQTSTAEPKPIRPVRAFKVGDVKAINGREFPGRATAKEEVDLSFQVTGPLVSLPVDVGSEVSKGDVIAAIDPRDFQAALDTAQGNLDRARANYLAMERGAREEEIEQLKAAVAEAEATYRQAYVEHTRNAKLAKTGVVTQEELELSLARAQRTQAQLRRAQEALKIGTAGARPEDLEAKRSEIRALESAVANAQNQLNYAVLTAPFDGEVAARYVDNFQTVQAKQPIVRLLDVAKIEVTVQVPESLIAVVPQVKQVVCRFDAFPGRTFAGQVTKIGSEASQTTRTYPVTVQISQPDDARILPGMAATIRAQPDKEAAAGGTLVVPASAVFASNAGQNNFVWVVTNGSTIVVRRAVKTGALTPVGLTIEEGLKVGEWVVISGVNSLRENQQVKILQEGSS